MDRTKSGSEGKGLKYLEFKDKKFPGNFVFRDVIAKEELLELSERLKSINFAHSQVSDELVNFAASRFKELKSIILHGAPNVTNAAVESLMKLPKLTTVDISMCRGIDKTAAIQLYESSGKWKTFVLGERCDLEANVKTDPPKREKKKKSDTGHINYSTFRKVDMRVGTIISVEDNLSSNKAAYIITVDFGEEIGIKTTSGQYGENYVAKDLLTQKVICVVNMPRKKIGEVWSEVLLLGTPADDNGQAFLLTAHDNAVNGQRVF